MLAKNQKLIFFSAIFVVIVAVAVCIAKPIAGGMSPQELWKRIERGEIKGGIYVITGVVSLVGVFDDVGFVYFKGCEKPFITFEESVYYYLGRNIGKQVSVSVSVEYEPDLGYVFGKNGLVVEIIAIHP